MIAGQLWEAAHEALPDLEEQIERGDLVRCASGCASNVHRHGRKLDSAEIVERATGRPIEIGPYVRYLSEKFGEIYGLDAPRGALALSREGGGAGTLRPPLRLYAGDITDTAAVAPIPRARQVQEGGPLTAVIAQAVVRREHPAPRPVGFAAMPRAQTNGIELEYESFGDPSKPTVLLIMGLGVQMLGWDERFCNMLADRGFHVVRFDNRDIGLSTKIEGGTPPNPLELMAGNYSSASYTLDDMADDTAGLLDALDVDAAHVVGVSMGGMIAQTLACRHPERVLSLTSIMSSTGSQETGQPKPEVFAALITPTPSDREGYVDAGASLFKLIGSPAYPPDQDELRALIGASYDRSHYPDGFFRQLAAILASGDRGKAIAGIERADSGDPRRGRPADHPVRRRGHRGRNPWIEAGRDPRHGARPAARPVATVHRRDRREHRAGERPRCHAGA